MNVMAAFGDFVWFSCRAAWAIPFALLRPRLIAIQAARFLAGALFLSIALGLAMGIVVWLHLGEALDRYDGKTYLPSTLMLAVVMEAGPVAVGLLAASRIASGIAAELAAMTVTEQVDALVSHGVSPIERLVAPRVIGCVLILPLLTILADYAALAGSYAAEWMGGDLSWNLYWRRSIDELHLIPAALATGKTLVFGLAVGLIACFFGLNVERTTEQVGSASTAAVAASTLAVLVLDVILVRLIQSVT